MSPDRRLRATKTYRSRLGMDSSLNVLEDPMEREEWVATKINSMVTRNGNGRDFVRRETQASLSELQANFRSSRHGAARQ
ncbi:hypothetical protein BC938DRAFT_478361, partial [Jimgerdemannia flammicorona]